MIAYLPLLRINNLHDQELRAAVTRVLDSGWYLKGDATRQFEAHYAEYIGTRYCIGCGNGLDALTLILRAYMEMGVMSIGDEVIDGKPYPEIVEQAREYIRSRGGFEKFAEWGLI